MERPETSTSQHDAQQVGRVVEQELECRIVGGDYDGDAVGRVARLEHRPHLREQLVGAGASRNYTDSSIGEPWPSSPARMPCVSSSLQT